LTNDPHLLLDECLQGELADEIRKWRKVSAEWICDNPALRNRKVSDEQIMAYAQERNRILVTVETRLNEQKFAICTHHGIIVFSTTKRHDSAKAQLFRRLMLSGQRKFCKHAVTYLRADQIVFRRRDPKTGQVMDVAVKPSEKRKQVASPR
jgi:predicted nuclease of predicted toxin-antitoxin system